MANLNKPTVNKKTVRQRISNTLASMINDQIGAELESAYIYLAMAQWLEYNGYLSSAKKFKTYFDEEQVHMHKFYSYLQDRDYMPISKAIPAPSNSFEDLVDVLQKSYEHEILVTTRLQAIADAAQEEGDQVTFAFMQWFLTEQIEEESKFKALLDAWDVLSKGGATGLALMELDEMVGED